MLHFSITGRSAFILINQLHTQGILKLLAIFLVEELQNFVAFLHGTLQTTARIDYTMLNILT